MTESLRESSGRAAADGPPVTRHPSPVTSPSSPVTSPSSPVTLFPDVLLVRIAALFVAGGFAVVLFPFAWLLFAAAGGLAALLAGWDWLLALRRLGGGLSVERLVPARVFEGREAEIVLRLRNDGAEPLELDVIDELPADLLTPEPRFAGVRLGAGERLELRYVVCPRVRGDRPLGTGLLLVRSSMGMWRRRAHFGGGEVVRVYPDASRFLRPEALRPQKVLATLGVRPSRKRGEGMDFESLRDYVPGDDPRRIDWAATARRGRPITRLYQHERNHTVLIALDTSRLMGGRFGGRSKLDYAVDSALALTFAALGSGDRVGMLVFDREIRGHIVPRSYRRDLGQFVDLLRPVHPRVVEPDYDVFLRAMAARQRQRALVVLFTDFADTGARSFTAPLAVLARRHRLLLVAVRDPVYERLSPAPPSDGEDPLDLYRRLVVDDLLNERETTLGTLRRRGVQTLDLLPEAMTAPVLNRYLTLRFSTEE